MNSLPNALCGCRKSAVSVYSTTRPASISRTFVETAMACAGRCVDIRRVVPCSLHRRTRVSSRLRDVRMSTALSGQKGRPLFFAPAHQSVLQTAGRADVHGAQRLVQKQTGPVAGEHAGKAHALAFAAGQSRGLFVPKVCQTAVGQKGIEVSRLVSHTEHDVLFNCSAEAERALRLVPDGRGTAVAEDAPFVRRPLPRDQLQERRFPGPVHADERDPFTVFDDEFVDSQGELPGQLFA